MSSFSIQVKPRLNLAFHLFYAHSPRAQHGERNTNPADSPHFTFMTLVLPENLKLCFPGKSVFPSVQVDYLISSSPNSNASSPILGKLMIFFFYFLENEKYSFTIPHSPPPPPNLQASVQINSDFPCCAGWTVNPSPVALSSSKILLLQLSLFCPASILPSLWVMPIRLVVKNPPATAGDERHVGLIPGQEDPLEEEMATHSSILA